MLPELVEVSRANGPDLAARSAARAGWYFSCRGRLIEPRLVQVGLGPWTPRNGNFKAVNDQYGHQVGDAVLQGAAALLRRAVRAVDLVARYGGEEFAIVLSEVSPRIALAICERLRRNIEQARFPAGDRQVAITASFGVAMFPVDAQEPTALVEVADRHLYASKQAGRNRVTCSRAVIEMAMSEAPASGATRSDASA